MQNQQNLASLIDHTALRQEDFDQARLLQLSQEALENHFNSICVRPEWLKKIFQWHAELKQDIPNISIVIGFPTSPLSIEEIGLNNAVKLSSTHTNDKLQEAYKATDLLLSNKINHLELDPVLDISKITAENFTDVLAGEINAYLKLCVDYTQKHPELSICLKPIFSSELLVKQALTEKLDKDKYLEDSVKALCQAYSRVFDLSQKLPKRIKVSYKNSTGFITDSDLEKGSHGAGSPDSLVGRIARLLNKYEHIYQIPNKTIGIKASGGIRDHKTALNIINDAQGRLTHIGTSSGVNICHS